MELTSYNDIFGKYEFASESESQYTKLSALQSLVLGNEIKLKEIPFLKEFKCVKDFFESPLYDKKETNLKKIFSAGIILGMEKGILPFSIEKTPSSIAATIDAGLDNAKIAYKVAIGDIDVIEAVDHLIDNAAAKTITIADKIIDKGAPIVITKLTQALTKIFPPAKILTPIINEVTNRATPVIKKVVYTGINLVASYTKDIVRTAARVVVNIGKKVSNWIKRLK
jgi:hypothetical protein